VLSAYTLALAALIILLLTGCMLARRIATERR
jgi:hypothetical protein